MLFFFFFKQKTAYEMRISDWSSDVCSSDLREFELVVSRVERHEQVEHLVEHFLRAPVGPVDLVDHDNRAQAQRQRLAGDELGLRHRSEERRVGKERVSTVRSRWTPDQ